MIGIVLFALAGLLLGVVHFAVLRSTVAAYVRGGRNATAWYLARLAASAVIWFGLVRAGGPLALATLGGFLVARTLVICRTRMQAEVP